MRWAIPTNTKDEAVDALGPLVREVADQEEIFIGTIRLRWWWRISRDVVKLGDVSQKKD